MHDSPSVLCIILNWNGWRDTANCLASLRSATYLNLRVVVVDNGSSDDSVERLTPLLNNSWGELIQAGYNRGYTGGVNLGLRLALDRSADYAFLLNNDATIEPDCLSALVEASEAHSEVGFAGPKILWAHDRTRLWSAGTTVTWRSASVLAHRNEPDDGRFDGCRLVDGLSGCALLVRRAALERVGLLDERYFAYYEDLDWCLRGARVGLRSIYVGDAHAYHAGSATANRGAGRSQSALINYYGARNGLLFMATHAPRAERPLALARLGGRLLAAEARVLAGGLALRRPGAAQRAWAIAEGTLDAARGRFGARRKATS